MSSRIQILIIASTILLLASCKTDNSQKEDLVRVADTIPKFEPNWESLKKNYKDPEWFNDQKFGIFIHWGAYAVPAYGSEWYPRQMYMDTATFTAQLKLQKEGPNPTYLHHKKTWGDQKEFGYKDFTLMFKAEKFNPAEWIDIFKKSGARYVIPVADHHDGFAMYKSNTTRWNAVNMGPKRDALAAPLYRFFKAQFWILAVLAIVILKSLGFPKSISRSYYRLSAFL